MPKDSTALELRRIRLVAEQQLREQRRGRRPTLRAIDAMLIRQWYRLPDDVLARLWRAVSGRVTRYGRM